MVGFGGGSIPTIFLDASVYHELRKTDTDRRISCHAKYRHFIIYCVTEEKKAGIASEI